MISPVRGSSWMIRSTSSPNSSIRIGRLLVRREDLDRVAPDPELAPDEVDVVALVLDVDEPLRDEVTVGRPSPRHADDLFQVLLGRAQAEDARTRWRR